MQLFRQLQHVVCVTRLRTVDILYEVLTGLLAGEVLTTRITTKGQCAFASHDVPEERCCIVVSLVA